MAVIMALALGSCLAAGVSLESQLGWATAGALNLAGTGAPSTNSKVEYHVSARF